MVSGVSARIKWNHSYKQHPYNLAKYRVLKEYGIKPPKKSKNRGFGKWSSVLQTKSLPIFACLHALIYSRQHKQLSMEWLQQLDIRGLMWWYLDDGTLLGGRNAVFSTHAFSKKEVRLLARYLVQKWKLHGNVVGVHRKQNTYWVLQLTVPGTFRLLQLISPYVPTSMQYKINWRPRLCLECQAEIDVNNHMRTCNQRCADRRRRRLLQVWRSDPKVRKRLRDQALKRYWQNPEISRKKAIQSTAQYRKQHPDRVRRTNKQSRKKLLSSVEGREKVRQWNAAYYQRIKRDPKRLAHRHTQTNQY